MSDKTGFLFVVRRSQKLSSWHLANKLSLYQKMIVHPTPAPPGELGEFLPVQGPTTGLRCHRSFLVWWVGGADSDNATREFLTPVWINPNLPKSVTAP